jgi:acyl carrier protein
VTRGAHSVKAFVDALCRSIELSTDSAPGTVSGATELAALSLDSLQMTEVIVDLEESLGLELDDSALEAVDSLLASGDQTVSDLGAAIRTVDTEAS